MAKSAVFTRIKRDVLAMTASIPEGRVSTFKSLGEHIDVMPRHVAYLLSTLKDEDRIGVPWHRVVADGGIIKSKNTFKVQAQIAALNVENIDVGSNKRVENWDNIFIAAADLSSGVPKQKRPESTA